ncbi:MAG: 4-hydroxythreonine-4-phosphate dehydrogenase PdxA [Alphaproteobacteria bacterium]|nr:4-hydroxythreonine-4-phosphate dehydrogenase PdxA [Alphaproteobacteria bacterium]
MPDRPPSALAVTMGEPAGIGPELALAAWAARANGVPPFLLIADPDHIAALARRLGRTVPLATVGDGRDAQRVFATALPIRPIALAAHPIPGRPAADNARAVIAAIDLGVELVRRGEADALVTNPIDKAVLMASGFAHAGHTEYLGERAGVAHPVMMLACAALKVVPVTTHRSLRAAIADLTVERIVAAGRIAAQALARDFAVPRPRLAIAGLNPHAGEHGNIGDEEVRIIAPAIAALRADGIDANGPAPADTLFHPAARARYDAALCMYHDQALIPIKTIDFERAVNVTLGLPFVRTSPDHGTAFDIAGHGTASAASLIAALELARAIAARRAAAPA